MAKYLNEIADRQARPSRRIAMPINAEQDAALAPLAPIRFGGQVRFAIDANEAAQVFETALRRAARPETMSLEQVQAYSAACGGIDHRMELAVLKEGFNVVSREVLINHLVRTVHDRLSDNAHRQVTIEAARNGGKEHRGGSLTSSYRGVVLREGNAPTVRFSLGSLIEPPIALTAPNARALKAKRAIPVSGVLCAEGAFQPQFGDRQAVDVHVHWRVRRHDDRLNTQSWAHLESPLDETLHCLGTAALSRLAEVMPTYLASLVHGDRGPVFVHVERLFRLGRVTKTTRIYLFYWRRLRDFLLWNVRTSGL